jgi:hypothetical protein
LPRQLVSKLRFSTHDGTRFDATERRRRGVIHRLRVNVDHAHTTMFQSFALQSQPFLARRSNTRSMRSASVCNGPLAVRVTRRLHALRRLCLSQSLRLISRRREMALLRDVGDTLPRPALLVCGGDVGQQLLRSELVRHARGSEGEASTRLQLLNLRGSTCKPPLTLDLRRMHEREVRHHRR